MGKAFPPGPDGFLDRWLDGNFRILRIGGNAGYWKRQSRHGIYPFPCPA